MVNDSKPAATKARIFEGRTVYTSNGWFAEVYADDAPKPYASWAAITRGGAERKAARMARKLNRLEKTGAVR